MYKYFKHACMRHLGSALPNLVIYHEITRGEYNKMTCKFWSKNLKTHFLPVLNTVALYKCVVPFKEPNVLNILLFLKKSDVQHIYTQKSVWTKTYVYLRIYVSIHEWIAKWIVRWIHVYVCTHNIHFFLYKWGYFTTAQIFHVKEPPFMRCV